MDWFVGGDRRAFWTVEYLRKNGLDIHCHGVPDVEEEPLPERISCLFLPMPFTDPRDTLEQVLPLLQEESIVVGGSLGECAEKIRALGANVIDLHGTEPLTTLNAVATAEGAVALLILESEITLWESEVLVIGAGRIGMLLAERLRDLGARVTVSARSRRDIAKIRALGMRTERTGNFEKSMGEYDFVINTVPAPVLENHHLQELKKSCILLELASYPGGFSMEDCKKLGLKGIRGGGLPGRFSPKTAGELYGEALLEVCKKEGSL